jgi:uncharacterized protein (TIGR04255 family)
MSSQKLKKAPLVEAIVEMRFGPKTQASPPAFDPNYSLLLGRLADQFKDQYPEHEPQQSAGFPAEMAAMMHMVQHRFRASKGGWPLVQVGPTIFTFNETEAYDWEGDFRTRAIRAVDSFFGACEKTTQVQVQSLLLRYIDALEFDWDKESLLAFLEKDLRTKIVLPAPLFSDTGVGASPAGLDFTASFRCADPKGMAHVRFASGESKGKKALIMETMVQSTGSDVPSLPQGFTAWLDAAHEIPSTWFKRLTEGNLYRRFQDG